MNFIDIERELERRIIIGLRKVFEVFEFSGEFRYNNDDEITRIIITPDFPVSEIAFKTPHIVVTNIRYQINNQATLQNNFYQDVSRANIHNYESEHIVMIPFLSSMLCMGEYDVSRNLANRLFYYISFQAYDYFSLLLKLNLSNLSKESTAPAAQYPEKIFQTPVNLQGTLSLSYDKKPLFYLDKDNISKPVDRLGDSIQKVNIKSVLESKSER